MDHTPADGFGYASNAMNHLLNNSLRGSISSHLARHTPRLYEGDSSLRRAAVAATIVNTEDDNEGAVILTRRSSRLRRHGGQWALPGGRIDDGESPQQACLRELSEEVGVELGAEQILGQMDDYVTRSGFCISSFVVWAGHVADFTINPDEVAFAVRLPLKDLSGSNNPRLSAIPESNRPVLAMHIESLGHEVFAPTAAVLLQLRDIALFGRDCPVDGFEQPLFAWK